MSINQHNNKGLYNELIEFEPISFIIFVQMIKNVIKIKKIINDEIISDKLTRKILQTAQEQLDDIKNRINIYPWSTRNNS